jgi:hypothetical protein
MFIEVLFIVAKSKLTQFPSSDEWIKKSCSISTCGILFGKKKASDTCYSMDEPWEHCAK